MTKETMMFRISGGKLFISILNNSINHMPSISLIQLCLCFYQVQIMFWSIKLRMLKARNNEFKVETIYQQLILSSICLRSLRRMCLSWSAKIALSIANYVLVYKTQNVKESKHVIIFTSRCSDKLQKLKIQPPQKKTQNVKGKYHTCIMINHATGSYFTCIHVIYGL